jgi:hypothetical protein
MVTNFAHRCSARCLQVVLILRVGGSANTDLSVVILIRYACLEELLETCIFIYFFNIICCDFIVSMRSRVMHMQIKSLNNKHIQNYTARRE